MKPDAAKINEVRDWLTKAAVDLRAAKHERIADPPITMDIVFHTQQLAEKTMFCPTLPSVPSPQGRG